MSKETTKKETNFEKKLALGISIFLVSGMFTFEAQKSDIFHLHTLGHLTVLAGISMVGLGLFYLSGKMWSNKPWLATGMFIMSMALRAAFFYYIEILDSEGVFHGAEKWTLHIGNVSVLFIELGYSFTQIRPKAVIGIRSKMEDLTASLEDWKSKFNDLKEAGNDLESKNSLLSNKVESLETTKARLEKDFNQLQIVQDELEQKVESTESELKQMSDRRQAEKSKLDTGVRLSSKFISMAGNVYLLACGECGRFHQVGRTQSQVDCSCGQVHVRSDATTLTKSSILSN